MNRVNSRSGSALLQWQHYKHCRGCYCYYCYYYADLWEYEDPVAVAVKLAKHGCEQIQLATRLDQRTSLKHPVWQPRCLLTFTHTTASAFQQEIRANAHETRDSISLISYAGCLGLSAVTSAKIHSKCASQPKIVKNSLKAPIFRVQGRSMLSMLVPLESSPAVLVMISRKSVSIFNRSHARRANSGKITIS